MKKNNKAFGLNIIKTRMTSFHSSFEGLPSKFGDTYVSSFAKIKYLYRNYWNNIGENVFAKKTWEKTDYSNKLLSFEEILDKKLKLFLGEENNIEIVDSEKKKEEIKKKIKDKNTTFISVNDAQDIVFKCIDVACFGGIFSDSGIKRAYNGAIQFSYGVNVFDDTEFYRNQISSYYRNSNDDSKDNLQSTLGSRSLLDEAHYSYYFSVNPQNYKLLTDTFEGFEGLTEEDYQKFKKASLRCASSQDSTTQISCSNELTLFVELKEDSDKYLGDLSELVSIKNGEDSKRIIDLTKIEQSLEFIKDDISSIEIYYNPIVTDIIFNKDKFKNVELRNIVNEELL